MTPADGNRSALDARSYLLGDGDEDHIQAFEIRLLAEPELGAALAEAEEQLIDDYVRNVLSERERTLLLRNFLTPARQREIGLSQLLAQESAAAREQSVAPLRKASPKIWQSTAAIVGGLAGALIVVVRDLAGRVRIDERGRILRLEEALRLASLSEGMLVTVDSSVRAPEPTVLQLPVDVRTIRLAFGVPEGLHAAYHVSIIANDAAGYREVWSADVPATIADGRARAIVTVPREALTAGQYIVQVTGRLPDMNNAREFGLRIP